MTTQEAIKILTGLSEPGKFEVVRIFETPRAGQEVDNGMGVDFDLSRFAIFYEIQGDEKEYSKNSDDFHRKLYNTEIYCNCGGVMNFEMDGVGPGLVDELRETDGYETIWEKGKGE